LRLIDHFRADIAVAPNFAYDLCARRLTDEQLEGLDLSCWTAAMNGSEPISAKALDAFAERFAPYGFRAEATYPCYGMAEATLFVSGGRRPEPPVLRHVLTEQLEAHQLRIAGPGPGSTTLVGCGRIVDYDLRIVQPNTRQPLPDGSVGEIWIRGDSIGCGYWQRAAETAATFQARTATGEGGFLRTGDLGAVLDGELFVTGRLKEMLIVHGRNIYPYDIERAIRLLDPAVAGGVGAVFGIGQHEQEVAVVYEVRSGRLDDGADRRLVAAVRELVSREYGVRVSAVSLVRAGQVPRTTSGKIQRGRTRQLFLSGALDAVYEEAAPLPSGEMAPVR
jgi:acyl-CoA synthetase (AMP-forming)/AMP-acid ligase II